MEMRGRVEAEPYKQSFANKILQNLPADTIQRLRLKAVDLPVNREIQAAGGRISHLFFLEAGVASITTTFTDGKQSEVGLSGFEGAIGIAAFMGTKRSLHRVYMQIAGCGFAAPVEACRHEFATDDHFRNLMLRYVQTQLIQAMQSASCNLSHHLEQRLARWLLLCADRSRTEEFVLSQEFIGMILGVRRTSMNLALARLTEKGFISHKRNKITIVNKTSLEACACECYLLVKRHLESFAEFDSGQAQ